MTHYIAMGGEHGCLPDNCSSYRSEEDAIGGLDCIYELTNKQKKEIKAQGLTELTRKQGGAYCSVSSCDCSEPWEHDEFGTPMDWPEYRKDKENKDETR